MPAPKVKCVVAHQGLVKDYIMLVAHVKALRSIDIVSRVDGFLEKRLFVEGSFVKANTQLYQIEMADYKLKLDGAKAQLAKASATALNAKLEFVRAKKLYEEGVDAPKQFDIARADFNAATSLVHAAQSAVATAALKLGYTKIVAPFSGWIGLTQVDVGKYVKAPSQRLTTLKDISQIRVEFNLPTSFLSVAERQKLAKGMAPNFQISLVDTKGNTLKKGGKITFWDNFIAKNSATIQLQVCFENADFKFLPGAFVRVKVEDNLATEKILINPATIRRSQAQDFVYIVNKLKVLELKPVVLGRNYKGQVVVEKGLKVGDKVVMAGNPRLQSGQVVDIIK